MTGPLVDAIYPDGRHEYYSTHCRHAGPENLKKQGHKACGAEEFAPGVPRRPSQCKTCGSPCLCPCHWGAVEDRYPSVGVRSLRSSVPGIALMILLAGYLVEWYVMIA